MRRALGPDEESVRAPHGRGPWILEGGLGRRVGQAVSCELTWEAGARERLQAIPSFARGMVAKAVEAYARGRGQTVVTTALLAEVRATWGGRFRATEP